MGKLTARKQEHDERPDEPAPRQESEQDDEHEKESGDLSLGTRERGVEDVPAVVENRSEPNEGAERPDSDRWRRSGQEMGRRHVHLVMARRQVVTHLVTKQDGEEREREGKPGRPATKEGEVPGCRIVEHPE